MYFFVISSTTSWFYNKTMNEYFVSKFNKKKIKFALTRFWWDSIETSLEVKSMADCMGINGGGPNMLGIEFSSLSHIMLLFGDMEVLISLVWNIPLWIIDGDRLQQSTTVSVFRLLIWSVFELYFIFHETVVIIEFQKKEPVAKILLFAFMLPLMGK